MAKDLKWLKPYKNNGSVKFNFEEFFRDKKMSLEDFCETVGYTMGGVIAMIARGTMKRSLIKVLSEKFGEKSITKYVSEPTNKNPRDK